MLCFFFLFLIFTYSGKQVDIRLLQNFPSHKYSDVDMPECAGRHLSVTSKSDSCKDSVCLQSFHVLNKSC